jgi:dienelactone hydrolase
MTTTPENLHRFLDMNYKPVGHIQKLPDGLEFYAIGNTESHRGVLLISDLFGWNTGRTRNLADFLAENGMYVVVPKLLVPTSSGSRSASSTEEEEERDYMKTFAYDSQLKPKIHSAVHHMHSVGVDKVSILSYSWGGWVTAHVLGDPDLANYFTCAAIAHPNITLEERIFGGNTAELFTQIQRPLLLIPTRDDPDEYRVGGAFFEPLKHRLPNCEVLDMHEMEHGFLPRGNIRTQPIYDSVGKCMGKIMEFYQKNNQ